MNYKNIYLNLCNRGKTTRKLNYSESHHILPRCMGGDDSENNLTVLTAKEHYLAHLLLTKIYDNSSLMYAFGMMQTSTKKMKRRYTSGQYQKMKHSYSTVMKTNNPMFNEETRKKMSETRREKFRNGILMPTVFSDSVRKEISKRMTGNGNPMRKFPEKNPFKGKSYVVGKKWYNNGINNLYLNQNDSVPAGFIPGMVYKKRK